MIPASLYQPDSWPLWALAVTTALVYPVRQVVLVALERLAMSKGRDTLDPRVKAALKRRALLVALIASAVFAVYYARRLFLG